MKTERLSLRLEEPGDDPISDQVFDVLCNTLQPNPELSADVAVTKTVALIPGREIHSTELNAFVTTCYEIAEQIPHYHVSSIKLVTVIDRCYNTLFPIDYLKDMKIEPSHRTYELSSTLRDWFHSLRPEYDCGPVKYVNFHAFIARILERGLLSVSNLAIWTIQDAFERKEGKLQVDRNAYVQAALQYLVIVGDLIFQEVIENQNSNEWDCWYKQVAAVAAPNADDKACVYGQDVVQLASQAMVAMEALQRLKTG